MSAYMLERKHFVAIAKFISRHGNGGPIGSHWIHVDHPEVILAKGDRYLTAAEAANYLTVANLDSVATRYNEEIGSFQPITDQDIHPVGKGCPEAVKLFGVLRSLRYQSCEVDDYEQTVGYAVMMSVLWLAGSVAAKEAGAEEWA